MYISSFLTSTGQGAASTCRWADADHALGPAFFLDEFGFTRYEVVEVAPSLLTAPCVTRNRKSGSRDSLSVRCRAFRDSCR